MYSSPKQWSKNLFHGILNMFKTFRNFPRKKDPANTIPQEVVNTFVIDGVNDTSGGVWISPTRNTTTDDGTLHIGLMNPFGGASATTVVNNACDIADPNSTSCVAACDDCQCGTVFAIENANQAKLGNPLWERFYCLYDNTQPSTGTGTCNMLCRLERGQFPFEAFSDFPCAGDPQYICGSGGSTPPHETSNILRAIERFILDLDITEIQNIDPNTISSAILRLPIKSKRDWM